MSEGFDKKLFEEMQAMYEEITSHGYGHGEALRIMFRTLFDEEDLRDFKKHGGELSKKRLDEIEFLLIMNENFEDDFE